MVNRFNVADLNAIETRVGAWLSDCQPFLEVFRLNRDPYLEFATKMYHLSYEQLEANYNSKDPAVKALAKEMRQMAKPGVLAGFYRQGPGGWGVDRKTKEPKKLGLWGYAENMGIDMTLEQAKEITRVFRASYQEVVNMWYALEVVVKSVLLDRPYQSSKPEIQFALDRLKQLDVWFDKVNIHDSGRGTDRVILRMHLPAGRFLHYMDAYIDEAKMPWTTAEGEEVYKPTLFYSRVNQETKQWEMGATAHGGLLFENAVQAIARDVLCDKLLIFEQNNLPVCGHVHDEGISETPNDPFWPGYREMVYQMSQPVTWAPTLPLGADGFEDSYYHK